MDNFFQRLTRKHSPIPELGVAFILSLFLFIVVEMFRDRLYFVAGAPLYLDFHNIVEFGSVVVSISIFSFGWFTYKQSKNDFALFLGVMFLGVAILDFLHALSFPGMPGFITPSSTDKGIQFWIAARLLAAVAFLVSAFIPSKTKSTSFPRKSLLVVVILMACAEFLWVTFFPATLPAMFIPGVGLTPLKIAMEYVIIALSVLALVAYYARFRRTRDQTLVWFMCALVVSVFGELAFTLYKSAYDTYNMLGHVYKLAAYLLIYRAIFTTSASRPYEKLAESERALEASVRTLKMLSACNQALVRAQNEQELLQQVCDDVVRIGGYRLAWVGFVDGEEQKGVRLVAQAGFDTEDPTGLARTFWADTEGEDGPVSTAVSTKTPVIMHGIGSSAGSSKMREAAATYGFSSVVAFPLMINGVIGAFSVYSTNPNAFTQDEVAALSEMASDLAYGIRSLRAYIHERQDEEQLRQSEEKFKAIFNNAMDGVILADVDTKRFFDANTTMGRMLGYDLNEIKGLGIADIHPKEDLSYVLDQVERQLRGERTLAENIPVKRRDGSVFYADINSSQVVVGGKKYLLGIFRDMSERKQAQEAIKESEEKFSKAFFASPNPMSITMPETGEIVDINDAFCEFFGYTREELISHSTIGLRMWVDLNQRDKMLEGLNRSGSIRDQEVGLRTKSGEIRSVLDSFDFILIGGKKYLLNVAVDITERKQSEAALRKSEADLEEAQSLAHLGSWSWDIPTNVITWSAEYRRIYHIGPRDPIPNFEEHLKAYTLESAAALDAAVKNTMETGEPYSLELQYAKPDIAGMWVLARGVAERDAQGKVTSLHGTVQDITETKVLEKMRTDFLSLASHQLRTPLSGTKWLIETLLAGRKGPLTTEQKEYLDNIYTVNERMIKLVFDMLAVLRFESGVLAVERKSVAAGQVFSNIISTVGAAAASKHVKVTDLSAAKSLPTIEADQVLLNTILESLVSNAIEYSLPGGEVVLDVTALGDRVAFSVKDSGIGIPKDEQDKVFDRFYRASNAKKLKPGGSGLGLYLAALLAKALGGAITFESEEGKGSAFLLAIPTTVPDRL